MTEKTLSEELSVIFGRDGGNFASGVLRLGKSVQGHDAAIRAGEASLKALARKLTADAARFRQTVEAGQSRWEGTTALPAYTSGDEQGTMSKMM